MTVFLQTCAGVLVTVILVLTLGGRREIGALLSITVCCMAAAAAMSYLSPVLDFLGTLETLGSLDSDMVEILLKAAGIGILSELAAMVCGDAGNNALGKTVQLLGTAVILWLSLPLFTALTELLQSILGEL